MICKLSVPPDDLLLVTDDFDARVGYGDESEHVANIVGSKGFIWCQAGQLN